MFMDVYGSYSHNEKCGYKPTNITNLGAPHPVLQGVSFGVWSTGSVLDVLQSTREALFGAVESDVAVDAAMVLATADR